MSLKYAIFKICPKLARKWYSCETRVCSTIFGDSWRQNVVSVFGFGHPKSHILHPKTAIFSNFGTARLLCFFNRLLFLICFSFSCFFLFLSSFLDARLPWLTSRLHFLIAFSLSHIPHSLFLCLLLIFFVFRKKRLHMKRYMTYFPKCMSSISLFHFMPMLSYILEFGLAGRCIISQYQLWNWSLYHKFHRACFVYHNQLTPRSALHGTARYLFAIKI